MVDHLRQNANWVGATNVELLLPTKCAEPLDHCQLQGVAFACTTAECKKNDVVLAYAEGKAPRNAKYSTSWTCLRCQCCDACYVIRWPSSDEDDSVIVVQR